MKIAIGTKNKLKIDAVKKILVLVWKNFEIVPCEVSSGVSETPHSDSEAIKGAMNRAQNALKLTNADVGIGAEGNVTSNEYGMFVLGWVAIIDKNGKHGIGSSGGVLIPKTLRKYVEEGMGLAEATNKVTSASQEKIRLENGTNGILSNGLYDRAHEFEDATRCALAAFVSPLYD